MSTPQLAKELIEKHLNGINDIHSENWNKLKWDIITKVMNTMNSSKNCVIDQFTVSVFYDDVFYNKINN